MRRRRKKKWRTKKEEEEMVLDVSGGAGITKTGRRRK